MWPEGVGGDLGTECRPSMNLVTLLGSAMLFDLIHVWKRKFLVKRIVHLSLTFPRSGNHNV